MAGVAASWTDVHYVLEVDLLIVFIVWFCDVYSREWVERGMGDVVVDVLLLIGIAASQVDLGFLTRFIFQRHVADRYLMGLLIDVDECYGS